MFYFARGFGQKLQYFKVSNDPIYLEYYKSENENQERSYKY
jgi:hypothetical protein